IESIPDILKEEEEIIMALNEMLRASEDDHIRELIEAREKARHDEASKLYNARMEGIAKGEQIGIAKGISQGEQIGIAKGISQGEQIGKLEKSKSSLKRLLTKK